MGKSKFRTLLMASVMIMLCAATIVGGTYALWSDNVQVKNHLSAGTLNVELKRTSLTKTYLDGTTGELIDFTDDTEVDFSGSTTENAENSNVFGLNDYGTEAEEKIVPNSAYKVRLKLINNGDVAVDYVVKIDLTSTSNDLAGQLKVQVADGDGTLVDKGYLSQYTQNGLAEISSGSLIKGGNAEFTVKITFESGEDNNSAQSQTAEFDLLVEATQKTR